MNTNTLTRELLKFEKDCSNKFLVMLEDESLRIVKSVNNNALMEILKLPFKCTVTSHVDLIGEIKKNGGSIRLGDLTTFVAREIETAKRVAVL
jgi:hypothetical protein